MAITLIKGVWLEVSSPVVGRTWLQAQAWLVSASWPRARVQPPLLSEEASLQVHIVHTAQRDLEPYLGGSLEAKVPWEKM